MADTPEPRPAGDLPDTTRPGRVRLFVSDLDRSIDWYRETLGFRVLVRDDLEARLGAHEEDRTLLELSAEESVRPTRPGTRLGLFHFALLLPSRAHLGRFVDHLAQMGVRPGAADHRVSEALYLSDPDGLGVEVYADRPRTEWVREAGEIRMTTDPLDLNDLRRAGGGSAWEGLPEGTTLGHMHLRVGDLDAAEAFYHRELGFDVTVRGYPGALFLSAGGYHHHLGVNRWAGEVPAPGPGEARLDHWTLEFPSADAIADVVERFRRAGRSVDRDGEAFVRDPWGTGLRLVARSSHGSVPRTLLD